eukprot:1182305-Prorocentrum_minimum.AAC.1
MATPSRVVRGLKVRRLKTSEANGLPPLNSAIEPDLSWTLRRKRRRRKLSVRMRRRLDAESDLMRRRQQIAQDEAAMAQVKSPLASGKSPLASGKSPLVKSSR